MVNDEPLLNPVTRPLAYNLLDMTMITGRIGYGERRMVGIEIISWLNLEN
jgi:hypothetical protein